MTSIEGKAGKNKYLNEDEQIVFRVVKVGHSSLPVGDRLAPIRHDTATLRIEDIRHLGHTNRRNYHGEEQE